MPNRLSEHRILAAWEQGAGRRPLDQALALLWAAEGVDAADLPLRTRNHRLLKLYSATFGPTLDLVAECPSCGEMLDVSVSAVELAEGMGAVSDASATRGSLAITSRHLAALSGVASEAQEAALAAMIAPDRADDEERDLVAAAVAESEITLGLTCADCGHAWSEAFDPVAPVWEETASAARALLRQVAQLAQSYGWTEDDVLRLSPTRRAAYLQLAGAA